MNEKQFVNELKKKGIVLNSHQISQFQTYYEILIEYNKKVNLTRIVKKEDVYLKHFYDSLTILFCLDILEYNTLCDVGSGAGFPSIPLSIVMSNLKITIIDALEKRIKFLNYLIDVLELNNVCAIHSRAEEYTKQHREKFDIVTARAVARLNVLSELCIPLVKENGRFIAMKGLNAQEELKESRKGIKLLGAELENEINFSLPYDGGNRNILIFKKIKKTPNKYPRNYSKIKNKPL